MKEKFKVFYEDKILDFKDLDDSVIIVLDANVLLHFFRYSHESQKKLFLALEKVKSNLFIPYQAALEYHYERQNILRSNKKNIEKLHNESEKFKSAFQAEIKRQIEDYGRTIRSTDEQAVREEVLAEFDKVTARFWKDFSENTLKKLTDMIPDNTETADRIADLLEDKVGEPLSSEKLSAISSDGSKRYSRKIPPGYKDSNKENDIRTFGEYSYDKQYGDLILWEEIKKYCQNDGNIKTVVFISEDEKEDWIFKAKGEKVGVRVELKQELHELVGARLEIFSPKKFLSLLSNENDIIKDYSKDYSINTDRSIFFIKTMLLIEIVSNKKTLTASNKYILSSKRFSEYKKYNDITSTNSDDTESQYNLFHVTFTEEFSGFKKFVMKMMSEFDHISIELYDSLSDEFREITKAFSDYNHFYATESFNENILEITNIINACNQFYRTLKTIENI